MSTTGSTSMTLTIHYAVPQSIVERMHIQMAAENLSQKGCMEIMKLFFTKDEDLYDKTIEDVFDDEVFKSDFWLYWRTMFAFENWHSALEMKLYFQRFIHHPLP